MSSGHVLINFSLCVLTLIDTYTLSKLCIIHKDWDSLVETVMPLSEDSVQIIVSISGTPKPK